MADRIPAGTLKRLIDKHALIDDEDRGIFDRYAPEGVDLVGMDSAAPEDEYGERDDGKDQQDGVEHEADRSRLGGYVNLKRGDEGMTVSDPDWIVEILEEADKYQPLQPWQRDLMARILRQPANRPLRLLEPRVY